jgi:putative endonuclease
MIFSSRFRNRFRKPKSVWIQGEDAAARFMKKQGCRVLARNLRLPIGEIDLLCLDRASDSIVIVEVKARVRTSDATPDPESSITAAKKRKLVTLAKAISKREDYQGKGIRIDVIAVVFAPDQSKPIDIRHYHSAVGS